MTGKEFADTMSNFVNNFSADIDGAVEALSRDHRTLQQGTMRFCVKYIEKMAESRWDLRNQASVEFAKEVVEKVDKRHMPFI